NTVSLQGAGSAGASPSRPWAVLKQPRSRQRQYAGDSVMPHLVIVSGPGKGKQHPLVKARTILGRDEKACDVLLLSHDQGRRRNTISRKHAVITCDDDKYYIEDGDRLDRPSHNGTSVNHVEVA